MLVWVTLVWSLLSRPQGMLRLTVCSTTIGMSEESGLEEKRLVRDLRGDIPMISLTLARLAIILEALT